MSLKEIMAADIDDVFFDAGEFAELHDINGAPVLCVLDDDTIRQRSSMRSEQYDGILLSQIKIFVRVSDLPKRPKYGKQMRFDNEPYIVMECKEQGGLYEITLGLNGT